MAVLARSLGPTLAVFLAALTYFACFLGYGFQVEDEGTILFQLDRAARGQLPYLDFHTGYSPGFFAAGGGVLNAGGGSAAVLRFAFALMNAAAAAGIYTGARVVAGAPLACAAAAAWVLFLPVYPGGFAAFNVPYPAWMAGAAWVALAVIMARWVLYGGWWPLVAAGLTAAAAFSVKVNAGAFAVAAITWIVVAVSPAIGPLATVAGVGASLAMGLGVWAALSSALHLQELFVHVLPVVVIVGATGISLRGRLGSKDHPPVFPALAVVAVSFLGASAIWMVPYFRMLGPERFAAEVLLLGSDAAGIYYASAPTLEPWAFLLSLLALCFAAAGFAVGRSSVRRGRIVIGLAVMGVVGVGLVLMTRAPVMPEGVIRSVLFQVENAAFGLVPFVHLAGLAWLIVTARSRPLTGAEAYLGALAVLGTSMYLQIFPRTDFMHVMMSMPVTFMLLAGLAEQVLSAWETGPAQEAGRGGSGMVRTASLVAVAMMLAFRAGLSLEAPVLHWDGREQVSFDGRLELGVEEQAGDELAALAAAAAFVKERTEAGEAVLGFPGMGAILFAAGRTSPVYHDYWFPGRPAHDEEAAMLDVLRADPPRFVATINAAPNFFFRALQYYSASKAFVADSYRLAARFGRYDILARKDLADVPPFEVPPPAAAPAVLDETRLFPFEWRRQAVRRWLGALTPTRAAAAALPPGRRDALLFLRGLRDAGDLRAAGWVFRGLESGDARVRREAENAAVQIGRDFAASRYRWANDFDATTLQPFVAAWSPQCHAILKDGPRQLLPFARAILSVLGDANPERNAAERRS